ncbi:hypothetical protein O5D80_000745 [Batrachochytrium dendrobatidis]|nr:hypothetical protein O5D80_000745 [Batrachochytrium dendrobatidis]
MLSQQSQVQIQHIERKFDPSLVLNSPLGNIILDVALRFTQIHLILTGICSGNEAFAMTPPVQHVLAHLCVFSSVLKEKVGTSLRWTLGGSLDHVAHSIR